MGEGRRGVHCPEGPSLKTCTRSHSSFLSSGPSLTLGSDDSEGGGRVVPSSSRGIDSPSLGTQWETELVWDEKGLESTSVSTEGHHILVCECRCRRRGSILPENVVWILVSHRTSCASPSLPRSLVIPLVGPRRSRVE